MPGVFRTAPRPRAAVIFEVFAGAGHTQVTTELTVKAKAVLADRSPWTWWTYYFRNPDWVDRDARLRPVVEAVLLTEARAKLEASAEVALSAAVVRLQEEFLKTSADIGVLKHMFEKWTKP